MDVRLHMLKLRLQNRYLLLRRSHIYLRNLVQNLLTVHFLQYLELCMDDG
jgi:hypothetical protein